MSEKPIEQVFNDIANSLATECEEKLLKDLANAYENLKKYGWQDIMYCPKDGSLFLLLKLEALEYTNAHTMENGQMANGGYMKNLICTQAALFYGNQNHSA